MSLDLERIDQLVDKRERTHWGECVYAHKDCAIVALSREVEKLRAQLAECFRLTGADPDGNEDWRLAQHAVEEVARLRSEYDELDENIGVAIFGGLCVCGRNLPCRHCEDG